MIRYKNVKGDSGVIAYELAPHAITVEFQDGWKYLYTEASVGAEYLGYMRQLAAAGRGLSTFISQFVRDRYARKWR
jgi:hypothetical protein